MGVIARPPPSHIRTLAEEGGAGGRGNQGDEPRRARGQGSMERSGPGTHEPWNAQTPPLGDVGAGLRSSSTYDDGLGPMTRAYRLRLSLLVGCSMASRPVSRARSPLQPGRADRAEPLLSRRPRRLVVHHGRAREAKRTRDAGQSSCQGIGVRDRSFEAHGTRCRNGPPLPADGRGCILSSTKYRRDLLHALHELGAI